jgi:hypothetical protein
MEDPEAVGSDEDEYVGPKCSGQMKVGQPDAKRREERTRRLDQQRSIRMGIDPLHNPRQGNGGTDASSRQMGRNGILEGIRGGGARWHRAGAGESSAIGNGMSNAGLDRFQARGRDVKSSERLQ